MYSEVNTKTNLPAQIEIYATDSSQYDFLFMAKGGGSANKTFLYQQTKALLNPEKLLKFVDEKAKVNNTLELYIFIIFIYYYKYLNLTELFQ
jgi:fumarate hydratase class I